MIVLYFVHHCRQAKSKSPPLYKHPSYISVDTPKHFDSEQAEFRIPKTSDAFLDERDRHVLKSLESFQNNVVGLVIICTPPLLSLFFCPFTLFLYKPITRLMWPPEVFPVVPDINAAISCYLVPAGMVYAITFGFAFQQVMEKNIRIANHVTQQCAAVRELTSLIHFLPEIDAERKIMVYSVVKQEIINTLRQILDQLSDIQPGIFCCIQPSYSHSTEN